MKTIDIEILDTETEEAEETESPKPWGLLASVGALGLLVLFAVPFPDVLESAAEALGITDPVVMAWAGVLLFLGVIALYYLLQLIGAALTSGPFWAFCIICYFFGWLPAIIGTMVFCILFPERTDN